MSASPPNTWSKFYACLHREATFIRELMAKLEAAGTSQPSQPAPAPPSARPTPATRRKREKNGGEKWP